MKRWLFIGILAVSSTVWGWNHYVASNGSDANLGNSKTVPWAHAPGMPGCTGVCATAAPTGGDSIFFRGGDTWGSASLGINWHWSGTSGARIYIGVDKTWFSGASWARPIFDLQNSMGASTQNGNIIWLSGNYTTIDNIELKGYQQSSGSTLIGVYGNYNEVENFYVHGWSRTAGSSTTNSVVYSNNFSGGGALGTKFHDNVIDGEDSPNKDFMGGILHGAMVYNNIIRYVYNGMNGTFTDIHGNLVEHNYVATSGDHCNMIFAQSIFGGGTSLWMYNNVVRHAGCAGGMTFWIMGNSGCNGCTSYAFNNVLYDNGMSSSKGMSIGPHPANGNAGTFYVYNNTIEAGGGSCMGNGEASPRSITHFANNHCINGAICDGTGTTCTNDGGNLSQTTSQANTAGYNANQTYAYFPISAASPTVGTGINATSLCSGNVAALCNDAVYPTYDVVNHTVVMRTVNARPSSGAWDAGAYQLIAAEIRKMEDKIVNNNQTEKMVLPSPIKWALLGQFLQTQKDLWACDLTGKMADKNNSSQPGIYIVGKAGEKAVQKVVVY